MYTNLEVTREIYFARIKFYRIFDNTWNEQILLKMFWIYWRRKLQKFENHVQVAWKLKVENTSATDYSWYSSENKIS